MKDYYRILDIGRKATQIEIKKQFRKQALATHPDKTHRDTKAAFIEVYEAYTVLSDAKKKGRYDVLYDRHFPGTDIVEAGELKMDFGQIQAKGTIYAGNFAKFDREILLLLLIELFFGVDRLLLACIAATVMGIWTIARGLLMLDFGYASIGVVLTLVGLVFGRMKIKSVMRECYL